MATLTMNAKSTLRASALALAAAALLAGLSAHAADEKSKPKNSAELAKPLKAASDAMQAKKYPEAITKLKEADANPKKNPYDQHLINEMLGFAYYRTQNYAEAAKVWEAELNDGFLSEQEQQGKVRALATINYQMKNYEKAAEYGQRAVKGGYADDDILVVVGQSYFLKNDWKNTYKFEDQQIEAQLKAGKQPKDETLKLAYQACVNMNDNDCAGKELERLIAYYPKPEYWQQVLYNLRGSTGSNDKSTLQVYRLMTEVDAMKNPDDYTDMAQLAIEQGSPGEAQRVLEKGMAKNVFTDQRSQDKNKRLLAVAKKTAATDQAGLPQAEKDANAAATGDKDVAVGLAYLGYQQYDKAAELLNKGLTKGGVKSEPEARLLLGIAQLKAGHKDDAVKTFHAVKGDPSLERLANLWTLHAKQA